MLLHPDIQKKCQAEIDAVCNNERLPDIADRDQLPYLSATMKELMRWQPVSPLGTFHIFHLHLSLSDALPPPALPHRVIKDDIYNGEVIWLIIPCFLLTFYDLPGCFIPAGAVVMGNTWYKLSLILNTWNS